MTLKGNQKKTFDLPTLVVKAIVLTKLEKSTTENVLTEREVLLMFLNESPSFLQSYEQVKKQRDKK